MKNIDEKLRSEEDVFAQVSVKNILGETNG
jgi:hypothetical protein